MVPPSWKRPSVAIVAWGVFLLMVFVVRGDLRVEMPSANTTIDSKPVIVPVVVRPERPSRPIVVATNLRLGRVFDSLGYLVVGAEVIAGDRPPERTNADGEFRLELALGQFTDVLVRAPGRRSTWVRTAPISPDALVAQLTPEAPWDQPRLPPPPVVMPLTGEGIVRSQDGSPLVGAYVTSVGSDWWSRTDEIGRYVLPLSTSTPTLLVHHPEGGNDQRGLAVRSEQLSLGRATGIVPLPELTAITATTIRGIVRNDRGAPLVGVPVQLRGEGQSRTLETGVDGAFHFTGLLPGQYEVCPFAFRGAVGRSLAVQLSSAIADCEIHLQPAEERRLRVLDERGSPLGRVYVATSIDGQRRGVAQTDTEGYVAVPVADETQFDVRTAELAQIAVRRFESEPATLIVAMP